MMSFVLSLTRLSLMMMRAPSLCVCRRFGSGGGCLSHGNGACLSWRRKMAGARDQRGGGTSSCRCLVTSHATSVAEEQRGCILAALKGRPTLKKGGGARLLKTKNLSSTCSGPAQPIATFAHLLFRGYVPDPYQSSRNDAER